MPLALAHLAGTYDTHTTHKQPFNARSASPDTPFLWCAESENDNCETPSLPDDSNTWTTQDSEATYCVKGWGAPYFSVNAAGHLAVRPQAGMST